jgi:3-oxoacyl-[acyl-carrier protein] reductase
MEFDFSGKTIIVTGAAHGFGRAISLAFARRGGSVWACDVLKDELLETERLVRSRRCVRRASWTSATRARSMLSSVSAASSRVDVLVNNAGGVLRPVRARSSRSRRQRQSIFDVNVGALTVRRRLRRE